MRKRLGFAMVFGIAIVAVFTIRECDISSIPSSEKAPFSAYPRQEKIHPISRKNEQLAGLSPEMHQKDETIDSVLAQKSIQHARQHGALASVVVEAVDETGTPVADADVDVYFYVLDKEPNRRTGKTDSSGHFTAAANATWDVRCFVRKNGFYEGIGRHYLQDNLTSKSVVDDRWQPWNHIIRVRMLQKGCPAAFLRKVEWDLQLPELGKPFGYDFNVGSLVVPHGEGLVPHVFFTISSASEQNEDEESSFLNIAFPGDGYGIVAERRDHGSSAELPRKAPINGYCQSTNLFHYAPGPARGKQINDDNNERIFVFRTKEPKGDTEDDQIRYGFMNINGFCSAQRRIQFWYGISKEPDNPNLEGFGW
ncbi:MAG: hypothetical protein ACI4QT_05820 [Kiritimatiellia bacterium]